MGAKELKEWNDNNNNIMASSRSIIPIRFVFDIWSWSSNKNLNLNGSFEFGKERIKEEKRKEKGKRKRPPRPVSSYLCPIQSHQPHGPSRPLGPTPFHARPWHPVTSVLTDGPASSETLRARRWEPGHRPVGPWRHPPILTRTHRTSASVMGAPLSRFFISTQQQTPPLCSIRKTRIKACRIP